MATLQLTASTLAVTPAAGQLEFDGHFYATDSANVRGKLNRLIQNTSQATTSGTFKDFTSIPNWVKRITVMFQGVSTSGTSPLRVQLGSGTITTTGYAGGMITYNTNSLEGATVTNGFPVDIANAGSAATTARHGTVTITNLSGNTYVSTSVIGFSPGGLIGAHGGSSVTLASVLDTIRITSVNGTDTFDAGSINIIYEG